MNIGYQFTDSFQTIGKFRGVTCVCRNIRNNKFNDKPRDQVSKMVKLRKVYIYLKLLA